MSTRVDLSKLPTPEVIAPLDFETVLAEMKAEAIAVFPDFAGILDLESEPATKLLEVFAYREVAKLRAHVNDSASAVMLAYATGANLEALAALVGVTRLTITEPDPEATPPVVGVYEADADLRYRAQLALEGFSAAGPEGAYEFHARSADARIIDVAVKRGAPGEVVVTYLAFEDGLTTDAPTAAVVAALNDEDVRPLCDDVTVQDATVTSFDITANLIIPLGPDAAAIQAQAEANLATFLAGARQIGRVIPRSAIMAALHVDLSNVIEVELTAPAADIEPADDEVALAGTITITREVAG